MTEPCLDPQLLAAFAERKLKRGELPAVLAHLERCPDCMSVLKAAMELTEEPLAQEEDRRRWWPLAAAAALAVVIGGGVFVQRTFNTDATDRLPEFSVPRAMRQGT